MTTSPLSGTSRGDSAPAGARMLVVILAFAWGLNWIASRLTLVELNPWGTRFISVGLGAAVLLIIATLGGRRLRLPRRQWLHIMVAGFFNVSAFNIFVANAQVSGATSRAIIIAYSMPIWSAVLAHFVLGERFTKVRIIALALCAVGLTTLIWPLVQLQIPVSALYALGCALAWAAGTIYMKWAKIDSEPLANAAWQLLFGWMLIAIGTLIIEGPPPLLTLSRTTLLALTYNGLIGFGLAYFLWFLIIERLPAMTASLGSLLVPVVGVTASVVILSEQPSLNDLVGFALIFAAAACVLLQPDMRPIQLPE
jgi:drug/metabolite transporter (DMT)-like permease